MRASTFKIGENAHKIKETTTFRSKGLRVFTSMGDYEKDKVCGVRSGDKRKGGSNHWKWTWN
jgi:hypothetical protein